MDLALSKMLAIAAGGGLGSVCRYLVAGASQTLSPAFPVGTLAVNVIGSAALGFIFAATRQGPLTIPEPYGVAVTVGFLGGFTTFSTFANESVALGNDAQWGALAANVALNNALALAAAWAGYRLAELIWGAA